MSNSTTQQDAGQVLLAFLQKSFQTSQVTGNSVLAGIAVGLGGSLLLFVGFCLVRPHNSRVYAPKLAPSPVLSAHPTAWLRRIFAPGDTELADALGLDAVVYLQFAALCRNFFLVGTVLAGAVVVPINIVYNLHAVNSAGTALPARSDYFFLTTPTLLRGAPMSAHVAVTWALDFAACWFVWVHTARIVALRQRRMRQAARAGTFYMRTVIVTEIPRPYMSDAGLARLVAKAATFKMSGSADAIASSIESVRVGRDVTELARLTHKHDEIVFRLEKILAKYLRDPNNLPLHRPVYKTAGGAKVDAIDHFFTKQNRVERQLVDARRAVDENRCLPYGFILFRSVKACHEFARTMEKKRRGQLYSELASRPEDIIWDNIVLTRVERNSKQLWGDFLFVCLVVGWIVPNAFMGTFLSQLSRMGVLWPAFGRFIVAYPVAFSLLQGALSPAVTAMVFLILPMLMRRLIQWQGKVTRHEREVDVTKRLYIFFVFNNLFIFTTFSIVWGVVTTVLTLRREQSSRLSLGEVFAQLGLAEQIAQAVLGVSSFWIMYVLRVNLGAVLDLLQLTTLMYPEFQRRFRSPTPRETAEWESAERRFDFASYYNWLLFYATIGFAFAVVQPLVLPVLAMYFGLDVIYKRYLLLYVFTTKAESDGQYWPFLASATLFAVGFGNVAVLSIIWVQGGWRTMIWLTPLLPFLLAFKMILWRAFHNRFHYYEDETSEEISGNDAPGPCSQSSLEIVTIDEDSLNNSPGSKKTFTSFTSSRSITTASTVTTNTGSEHSLAKKYENPALAHRLLTPTVFSEAEAALVSTRPFDGRAYDVRVDFVNAETYRVTGRFEHHNEFCDVNLHSLCSNRSMASLWR
jgi:hypothetical protein